MRAFTAPAVLALALALAGCQLMPKTPARVDPVAIVQPPRISNAAEEAIGARENPRVTAEYGGVYSDPEVEAAIAVVVARLVAASPDPSRSYRVTMLNSPVANAFALPGGYLYVTRGLVALTSSSSELAAVLSHEMSHVLLNHALSRAQAAEQVDIVDRVATDVISDPVESNTARAGSRVTLASFSRNQEIEADKLGISIAGRAGFDPFAASRFLTKLQDYASFRSALGKTDDATSFLASHPATAERRDLALVVARQFGAPGVNPQKEDGYLKALDGMVYGDDPSEGFVRGREFFHPRLAIAFSVPPAFRLENTREAVLAAAGQNTAMRFDGVTVEPAVTPAAYLASGWINGLIATSIRETEVNGLQAATAQAAAGDWVFRIAAVRSGNGMYRIIFADRGDQGTIDAALAATLASFRKLDPSEVTRLRPLRLDVVAARPGDSVGSLAARMQGTERGDELFRLLNGLTPADALEPGRLVKLVEG